MTIAKFQGGDAVTMTSLELVDFINQHRKHQAEQAGEPFPSKGFAKLEHADLLKKVPEVLGGGVGNFSDTYVHPQNGQTYPCYRFPKRESCLMAMSYSYDLQAAVFDYMTELEQKLANPQASVMAALNDPAVLQGLLLENVGKVVALTADNKELSSENLLLEQKVTADAPKVEFHDQVVVSHGVHYVREVAQSIGTGQNRLFEFLKQKRWVDRYNQPYQAKIEAGYLVASAHSYKDEETGERKTKFTCRVTGKGFAKIQELWAKRDEDLLEDRP
ncbi:phage antirepressor YoqD-like protein [Pseudomonas tolaasii NCPPB 2192]|uniref:Phage antirepressor YoqD-like protein n=1 Tax=Pseudomonas tolaasii NCPPB 2192 TaxID=564423 RepID=A0ABX4QDK8_PSETO|nr:phage antirepressor KilAC domain-containing protein [Pseudomonas tolaasii]PKA74891.1 phage antirepressor YoqD-like protein [Pseudomonas tolaasii NCPPB 2192]